MDEHRGGLLQEEDPGNFLNRTGSGSVKRIGRQLAEGERGPHVLAMHRFVDADHPHQLIRQTYQA